MTTAPRRAIALLMMLALVLAGCSTYGERVAPVPMPTEEAGAVSVDGARLIARAYVDPAAAERAFGFDIRGAGLLPVQFVVDNQSGRKVALQPEQTLLLDGAGNAWPLLASDTAAERVRSSVEMGQTVRAGARGSLLTGLAGAVAGAAIGIVTGRDVAETAGKGAAAGAAVGAIGTGASEYAGVGRDIQNDLQKASIRDRLIREGELAYGFLFFPGRDEAESARSLRLGLRVGDTDHVVSLPVTVVGEDPSGS